MPFVGQPCHKNNSVQMSEKPMKKEKKHIELPRKAVIASSQQYFLIILGVILRLV